MQGILWELTHSTRRQFLIFALSLPVLCALLVEQGGAEVWTDSTGTHSVTAEFLGLEGERVALRGANGKRISIPLVRLDAPNGPRAISAETLASQTTWKK
ncbi:MAG: SHD1 domain-containing protein [Bythopirellula sp.]|nr:SHD1 domain-containing protein [Bythopirellula sp.]